MTGIVQVHTTFDSEAGAAGAAAALVERRLAACAQVQGPVRSTFRWRGAIERAEEWLCVAKTTEGQVPGAIALLRALHPYDQPEILVTPVVAGDPGYLQWVRDETVS